MNFETEISELNLLLRENAEEALLKSEQLLRREELPAGGVARAWILCHRGAALNKLNRFSDSSRELAIALELFRTHHDKEGTARTLLRRSITYRHLAEFELALQDVHDATVIAEELANTELLVEGYRALGIVYRILGQPERSAAYFKQALAIAEELGDHYEVVKLLNALGGVYYFIKQYDKAKQYFEDCIEQCQKLGVLNVETTAIDNLANVYYSLEQLDKAYEYRKRAIELARELKDYEKMSSFLSNMGTLLVKKDDMQEAQQCLEEARRLAERSNNLQLLPYIYCNFGELYIKQNKYEYAVEILKRGLAILKGDNINVLMALHISIAEAYEKLGDAHSALEHYKQYHEFKERYEMNNSRQNLIALETQFRLDRTERERVRIQSENAELNEANERLAALVQQKDEVLQIVSHDLRSPLNTIIGMANLMHEHKDELTETDMQDLPKFIETVGWRLLGLVNNLLTAAQLISEELPLDLEVTSLQDVVEDSLKLLAPLAAQKSIAMEFTVDDVLPAVELDRAKIGQVVNNLIGNGIKFTPQGGKVTVHISATDSYAEVTIKDSGIGIDKTIAPLIFQKFRAHRRGTYGETGTGLGLAIAKHFVTSHQGDIDFDSIAGEGTTFHVKLPLRHPGKAEEKV